MSAIVPDYHTIDFPLTSNVAPASIDFLPHGTRTLKIKVTNPDRIDQVLVLRSEHLPQGFGVDKFYSHEEGGADFRLSWGGGHEAGACLLGKDSGPFGKIEVCAPLLDPPSDRPSDPPTSFVYLNVTHIGGSPRISRKVLLSVQPETPSDADALYTLPLTLNPPVAIEPVRFERLNESTFGFRGEHLPSYLPRWWSPSTVTYNVFNGQFPQLRLEIEGQDLNVFMACGSKSCDADYKLVAHLHDNIKLQDINQARNLRAELYHFTRQFFVLRIWFFWLQKEGLATIWNEIPDAERFDLIIDAKNMCVTYAGTDSHWREIWINTPRHKPAEAQLGLFAGEVTHMRQYAMVRAGLNSPYCPTEQLKIQLETGARYKVPNLSAAGPEAHVPYFVNGQAIDISSDPRSG